MSLSVSNNNSASSTSTSQTTQVNSSSSISFAQALEEFYELHQRSQITGVSTSDYNNALESLGIDSKDSRAAFEGIELLQSNGYSTGKPTDEAILEYGSIDQDYGNKTYMKNGVETSAQNEALQEEIAKLSQEAQENDEVDVYEGAKNYYEIALNKVKTPIEMLSSGESPITTVSATTTTSTEESIDLREQITNLLKADKNLLRDVLSDLL